MPPETDKYAVTSWGEQLPDLTMPSGQLCQARRPGLKNLIKIGILDMADPLLGMVDTKHVKRVQGKPVAPEVTADQLLQNPELLNTVVDSIDKVVMYVVVRPRVMPVPLDDNGDEIPFEDRSPGAYIDLITDEDKMFIFNYAIGGSTDIERFREQLDGHVADLADGGSVQSPAKRTTRPRTSR